MDTKITLSAKEETSILLEGEFDRDSYSKILKTAFFQSWAIDTKAEQAIVMDFDTSEILFEKNSNSKTPPASMTIIMTVYAAFDRLKNTNFSVSNECNVSAKAYKMGGSRTFLEIDDKVSIDELLKGIIIQSGNDASVAFAECLAGTEVDFAKLMNVYAKRIGMKNTNFLNSSEVFSIISKETQAATTPNQ